MAVMETASSFFVVGILAMEELAIGNSWKSDGCRS
jgi:hypothetical protein